MSDLLQSLHGANGFVVIPAVLAAAAGAVLLFGGIARWSAWSDRRRIARMDPNYVAQIRRSVRR